MIECYEDERIQECAMFSMSFAEDQSSRESQLSVTNCTFFDLHTENCKFSVIERDDMKGFNVYMDNICVVPGSYVCIGDAPLWLRWLIGRVCRRVVWPRAAIAKARGKE